MFVWSMSVYLWLYDWLLVGYTIAVLGREEGRGVGGNPIRSIRSGMHKCIYGECKGMHS